MTIISQFIQDNSLDSVIIFDNNESLSSKKLNTDVVIKQKAANFNYETEFYKIFPKLVQKIVTHSEHKEMKETNEWLSRVMEYNVPNGKRFRGCLVVNAFAHLMKFQAGNNNDDLDPEKLEQAYILGWCVEMLHTAHKLKTDIIANRKISRGQESWHLNQNLGAIAFNDAILLNGAMYLLLKEYFQEEDYYASLLNLFHEAQLFRSFGHCLETKTSQEVTSLKYLNLQRYEAMIKYQVGYFSYYFPIAAAMQIADFQEPTMLKDLMCNIGLLSQVVQDCKLFNNIQEGKEVVSAQQESYLNWYLFMAMQKASPEQIRIVENYYQEIKEQENSVEKLFNVYKNLGLGKALDLYIENLRNDISKQFQDILGTSNGNNNDNVLPETLFKNILSNIGL